MLLILFVGIILHGLKTRIPWYKIKLPNGKNILIKKQPSFMEAVFLPKMMYGLVLLQIPIIKFYIMFCF